MILTFNFIYNLRIENNSICKIRHYKSNNKPHNTYHSQVTMSKKRDFDELSFESDSCAICLNTLSVRNHTVTPCGHHFCMTCITQHVFNKKTCPICRQHFDIPRESSQMSSEEMSAIVLQNSALFPFTAMLKDIFEQYGVPWSNLTVSQKARIHAILRQHIQGYSMTLVFDVVSHMELF